MDSSDSSSARLNPARAEASARAQPAARQFVARLLLVLAAYYLTARLGLLMPYFGTPLALVWLPTGIAVAAFRRWGIGMAAAVFVGATGAEMSLGLSWSISLLTACGNTAGTGLAAWLLRRWRVDDRLLRRRDVLALPRRRGGGHGRHVAQWRRLVLRFECAGAAALRAGLARLVRRRRGGRAAGRHSADRLEPRRRHDGLPRPRRPRQRRAARARAGLRVRDLRRRVRQRFGAGLRAARAAVAAAGAAGDARRRGRVVRRRAGADADGRLRHLARRRALHGAGRPLRHARAVELRLGAGLHQPADLRPGGGAAGEPRRVRRLPAQHARRHPGDRRARRAAARQPGMRADAPAGCLGAGGTPGGRRAGRRRGRRRRADRARRPAGHHRADAVARARRGDAPRVPRRALPAGERPLADPRQPARRHAGQARAGAPGHERGASAGGQRQRARAVRLRRPQPDLPLRQRALPPRDGHRALGAGRPHDARVPGRGRARRTAAAHRGARCAASAASSSAPAGSTTRRRTSSPNTCPTAAPTAASTASS